MHEATRLAIGTALSGPAGGVAAAVVLSRAGLGANIIGFDMGGTSTDIAVIRDGQPTLAGDKSVASARIALPSLDIVTLGAGGGSIGKLNRSGLLAVGPESAGAVPGPACYGQGGTAATVTDANLVLGYLDPANFLGGRRHLDVPAATDVVAILARGCANPATALSAAGPSHSKFHPSRCSFASSFVQRKLYPSSYRCSSQFPFVIRGLWAPFA